jgi:hypothetical protein
MRFRGVLLAVVAVLVVAGGLIALGVTVDASPGGIAAIVAAVAFGAAMLGVMALLLSLIGTVRQLTIAVEQVTAQTLPLLGGVTETVAGVNTELARVDGIVASVQHISHSAEGIADVVHAAVANPLIKAIAFATGTSVALKAAKKAT